MADPEFDGVIRPAGSETNQGGTPPTDDPGFEVRVNGDRVWKVNSEFSEYDATHAVAGALLAGADTVEVKRIEEGEYSG